MRLTIYKRQTSYGEANFNCVFPLLCFTYGRSTTEADNVGQGSSGVRGQGNQYRIYILLPESQEYAVTLKGTDHTANRCVTRNRVDTW
jgi:hypothetical protein